MTLPLSYGNRSVMCDVGQNLVFGVIGSTMGSKREGCGVSIPGIRGRIGVAVEALPDVLAIWSGTLRGLLRAEIAVISSKYCTALCNTIGSLTGSLANERHHNDRSY